MALIEINPMRPGGNNSGAHYYVAVSSTTSKTSVRKTSATQVSFVISTLAMKDLRWVSGDKVKLLLDAETNEVHVRRAAPGSPNVFTLSGHSTKKERRAGTTTNSDFKVSDKTLPRLPMTRLQKNDCYIADNGDLVFVYPAPLNLPQPAKPPAITAPDVGAGALLHPAVLAHRVNSARPAARR